MKKNNLISNENEDQYLSNIIKTINNKIYFYAPVTSESIFKLNSNLFDLKNKILYIENKFSLKQKTIPIYIYVNSDGGSIISALSAYDTIRELSKHVDIYTVVDGSAFSAAAVFILAANKRYIRQNSYVMFHHLSTFFYGNYNNFKDEFFNLNNITNNVISILHERTKLDKKTLNEVLNHDIIIDAKTCVKYGIVHEILK